MFPCNGEHTLLRFNGGSRLVFNGGDVRIMKGCSIVLSYGGELSIGEDVLINQRTLIYSNSSVEIGSHSRTGWYAQIYDTPFHYMIDTETGVLSNPCKPIVLGNNVWIANHATITAGTRIPAFTTVASHALVNKDFSGHAVPGGVLMGTPATYRDAHKVRLLNDLIEYKIKNKFKQSDKKSTINLSELGYSAYPLSPEYNPLYRSNE